MTLYLRTRRARLLVGVLITQAILGLTIADASIPVPNLRSGQQGAILISLLVPLLGVAAVSFGLFANRAQFESVSVRMINRYDAGIILAAVLSVLVSALLSSIVGATEGVSLARNFIGLLGVALIARSAFGLTAAYTAPVLVVVAVALFNSGRLPATQLLEWPIHEPWSAISWSAAASLLTIGLVCLLVRPERSV